MLRVSMRMFLAILASALCPSIAHAQSISGCGAVAVAKADQSNKTKLEAGADCFGKAAVIAQGAVDSRKALLAKITPAAPAPTPPASPAEPAPIKSNFDVASELVPWGQHPDREGAAQGEVVGAFRFICSAGQVAADDPIVYPGQPGASHLHQFFGNDGANAASTFATLRTTGNSTCQSPLNRSGYWQPALLNEKGQVIRPDYWQIYYKRPPKDSVYCAPPFAKACVGIPRGLKMIFGYNMDTGAGVGMAHYLCVRNGRDNVGDGANIRTAMKDCKAGDQLEVRLDAPACWDGKNIDSPDHRSHVDYRHHDNATGGDFCDAAHPYMMPTFTLAAFWSIQPGENPALWRLSSDAMVPNSPPGTTFHADFFSAWDDDVENTWVANCIDRLLSCSAGDLGNGSSLKWPVPGTLPRVVDAP